MVEKKIKVLIVEDSLVNQKLLSTLVSSDSRFDLVAIANNGVEAIECVTKYRPHVISMDIHMPIMDGVSATIQIMQENPIPIVIVSSYYNSSEVEMAIRVLEAGAVTILPKPFGPGHPKYEQTARKYLSMLVAMSEIKVVRRKSITSAKKIISQVFTPFRNANVPADLKVDIVVIGASAGGPEGLRVILSNLPEKFPYPVFIVQHIDANFGEGFCAWLNTFSKLPVHIAKEGETCKPGNVYMPPGDRHLILKQNKKIGVTDSDPIKGFRPSVSVLFKSAASVYGKNTLAILLSGMGKDGSEELKILHDLGAYTIVQDEQSCLVFGMPGEAVRLGAACKVLNPKDIVKAIIDLLK